MWLLVISAIVFPIIVYVMPKKIARTELYATTGFATYVQLLTDLTFHLKLNWYGYFSEAERIELKDYLLVPLYISINPLFLNFYPYNERKKKIVIYIILWSVFSVVYEYFADKMGMFYHNQWKIWYSALLYPILFILLRLQLALFRYLNKKDH